MRIDAIKTYLAAFDIFCMVSDCNNIKSVIGITPENTSEIIPNGLIEYIHPEDSRWFVGNLAQAIRHFHKGGLT